MKDDPAPNVYGTNYAAYHPQYAAATRPHYQYPQNQSPYYNNTVPPSNNPYEQQGQTAYPQYGHQYSPYAPPPLPPPPPVVDESGGGGLEDGALSADLPQSIRNGFIRKVYGILTVQLIYTFGIALAFNLWEGGAEWLANTGWWMIIIGAVLAMAGLCALACVPTLAKKVPLNYFLLFVMTTGFAIIMAYAGATVDTQSFVIALGITAVVVVGLTLFACQTKIDFTGMGPYLFVFLLVLIVFGIVAAIVRNRILHIVYAGLGALLFSFYLVYDTQVIVGGKHRKYQFSIDDYVFGAIALYIDIINLFLYILTIVGYASN